MLFVKVEQNKTNKKKNQTKQPCIKMLKVIQLFGYLVIYDHYD